MRVPQENAIKRGYHIRKKIIQKRWQLFLLKWITITISFFQNEDFSRSQQKYHIMPIYCDKYKRTDCFTLKITSYHNLLWTAVSQLSLEQVDTSVLPQNSQKLF